MKTTLFLILALAFALTSCTEEFKTYDPSKFNAQLQERVDIETPEELITVYYNYPESEGVPNLEISSKELRTNHYEIMLIHDKLQDDSQRAIKIVMQANKNGEHWVVDEIKKNWKCWDGRGHINWGIEFCN